MILLQQLFLSFQSRKAGNPGRRFLSSVPILKSLAPCWIQSKRRSPWEQKAIFTAVDTSSSFARSTNNEPTNQPTKNAGLATHGRTVYSQTKTGQSLMNRLFRQTGINFDAYKSGSRHYCWTFLDPFLGQDKGKKGMCTSMYFLEKGSCQKRGFYWKDVKTIPKPDRPINREKEGFAVQSMVPLLSGWIHLAISEAIIERLTRETSCT